MDLCRLEPNLNETLPKMAAWSSDVTQKMSRGRISFLPQAQAPRGLKRAWMHDKHCSIFGPIEKFQRIHFKYSKLSQPGNLEFFSLTQGF